MRCPQCNQVVPRYPRNAGKLWTKRDERRLYAHACRLRKKGLSADEAIPILASRFERTHYSILSRLVRLDLITP